jgi:hypothetical protein
MPSIGEVARQFFDACERGEGWEACNTYCVDDATFSVQADALTGIKTLKEYVEWMKGLLTFVDGSYEIKAFATDEGRRSVIAFAVLHGIHTGEGGPVPATNKSVDAEYVYVMQFDGDKIRHMDKIWNDGWTMKKFGWVG